MRRLSFGLVDGRPVFMDLLEDSYFMLDQAEEAAFLEAVGRGSQPTAVRPNTSSGVAAQDDLTVEPASCTRPRGSALRAERGNVRTKFADVLNIWRLMLKARSNLRRLPIANLLQSLDQTGVGGTQTDNDKIAVLAMRFSAARRFVPVARNCLTDSLALLAWLFRHGEGATLVFGVKLDPFAAHCWVQTDTLLLNDYAERVERFAAVRTLECTPVLP